jgi:hypothetical protein
MKKDSVKGSNLKETNLAPKASIPASELWLYKNPEALASVKQGMKEAAEGKFSKVDLNDL